MTKTIKHLESPLRFEKAGIRLIKLGLIKLLKAFQHLCHRLGGVKINRPFPIADDELMHGFATMNLSLAGAQSSEESFQSVVGAVTLGPSITSEQSRPALPKDTADMSDH